MWSGNKIVVLLLTVYLSMIFGCNSLEENLTMLKSKRAEDRVYAIEWLYYNTQEQDIKNNLLQRAIVEDESELVRSLVIRLMVLSGDKKYVPLIEKALDDKHYLVRVEAAQALGSFKSFRSQELFAKKMEKDPHAWVRLKVLKSIDYMTTYEHVPDLPAVRTSEKPVIRFQLFLLPNLIKALSDHEPNVRFQSRRLLERFTGKDFPNQKKWEEWHKAVFSS